MGRPGTYPKGKSGNSKGRPKKDFDLIALAKSHAPDAFKTVLEIAQGMHPDLKAKLKASEIIFDRAYGRPSQAVNVTGELTHTVTVKVNLKDVPK